MSDVIKLEEAKKILDDLSDQLNKRQLEQAEALKNMANLLEKRIKEVRVDSLTALLSVDGVVKLLIKKGVITEDELKEQGK